MVPPALRQELQSIQKHSTRARDIIRNLSRFVGRDASPSAEVKLADVVQAALQLRARDGHRDGVECHVEIESLRSVVAGFTELQQVVLNFVTNAELAIGESAHRTGRIVIRVRDAGDAVRLEVADNGPGVRAEDQAKLFQPFFTTRPVGQGTGLGLSVSYGIIDASGGRIGYLQNEWGGAFDSRARRLADGGGRVVMTERLYYTDPYQTEFEAVVERAEPRGGHLAVVLNRTAFYPTSGGQPYDTGTISGAAVVDVIDTEAGAIEHLVEGRLEAGQSVHGAIDWARRFDHMQQHTGQHVLSAAFDRLHGARTISFHLGRDTSTIDLEREVSPALIAAAEDEANRIVWQNDPVAIRFVSDEEAARLPLRKPPAREGTLRLIEIAGFDLSACGGRTSVAPVRLA